MLPTAEKPVRNLPASIHLHIDATAFGPPTRQQRSEAAVARSSRARVRHPLARSLPYAEESWLAPKNRYGIGTNTYMNAARQSQSSRPRVGVAAYPQTALQQQQITSYLSEAATSCATTHSPAQNQVHQHDRPFPKQRAQMACPERSAQETATGLLC